jgi:hypothetical protein
VWKQKTEGNPLVSSVPAIEKETPAETSAELGHFLDPAKVIAVRGEISQKRVKARPAQNVR